ncbi:MAG: hypothetical protein CVU04_00295 [Bacteroidetes bacterium HGW-Bacteroidetes-20]|nr:MAG: hypothetical protein CVU04_00295 [Bacteroidetes bacterium HGW-Bacteroidetes-20]
MGLIHLYILDSRETIIMKHKFTPFKNRDQKSKMIFGFLMFLMLSPLLFSFITSWKGPELNSVQMTKVSIKDLGLKNFLENIFQDKVESACKNHIAFNNYWIRAHNELQYRLFRISATEKLVLGKNDFFYEEMYITEYLGRNFIGEDLMNKKVQALKKLQEILLNQYNIYLIPVIEPGKAHFSPEEIPDRFHPNYKTRSNYESFRDHAKNQDVTFLDLNQYFKALKPTSPHLLYSKYGVHWSSYGMWQAADTLTKFIEQVCQINLPDIIHLSDSNSTYNKDLDFDLEPPMNLLFPLPHESMNFPNKKIVCDSTHTKPKVLTVGDSYYWSLMNNGYTHQMFSENPYWYYNKTIWPDLWNFDNIVDTSKLKEIILQNQIVLIMITDANLYKFGWEFVEQSLQKFAPQDPVDSELLMLNYLFSDINNYNYFRKEAIRKQIPFSEYLKIKIAENNNTQ